MKSPEEQIKALEERHQKEISDLRASLIKPQFEVGKWYKSERDSSLWLLEKIDNSDFVHPHVSFGFDGNGIWTCSGHRNFNLHNKNFRLATEQEIKDAIETECKKRYKIGNIINNQLFYEHNVGTKAIEKLDFDYRGGIVDVSTNDGFRSTIYSNGKWAEIISAPKLTFGGHEVTIDGHKITCKDVVGSYEELRAIYESFHTRVNLMFGAKRMEAYKDSCGDVIDLKVNAWDRPEREIKIGCTWGTMGEIKNILTAVEKK